MKKIKLLSLFMVLLSAISFTSCDTEPLDNKLLTDEDPTTAGPAVFTVDFGGKTFTATSTQAVVADGVIVISGVRGSKGETVGLAITGSKVGTYSGDNIILSYDPSTDSEYTYNNFDETESNGTVTITSINTTTKTISGTFNFTGYWGDTDANLPSVAFTNGKFTDIPYTTTTTPGGGGDGGDNGDDQYVKATVAGAAVDFSGDITKTSSVIDGVTYINIFGQNPTTQQQITLNLNGKSTAGTYTITDSALNVNASYSTYDANDNYFNYIGQSGTLTIISNTGGYIKGTFSFSGLNPDDDTTIQVTAGTFYIEL